MAAHQRRAGASGARHGWKGIHPVDIDLNAGGRAISKSARPTMTAPNAARAAAEWRGNCWGRRRDSNPAAFLPVPSECLAPWHVEAWTLCPAELRRAIRFILRWVFLSPARRAGWPVA